MPDETNIRKATLELQTHKVRGGLDISTLMTSIYLSVVSTAANPSTAAEPFYRGIKREIPMSSNSDQYGTTKEASKPCLASTAKSFAK